MTLKRILKRKTLKIRSQLKNLQESIKLIKAQENWDESKDLRIKNRILNKLLKYPTNQKGRFVVWSIILNFYGRMGNSKFL